MYTNYHHNTYRRCALDDVTAVVAFAGHQSEPFSGILVLAQLLLERLLLLRVVPAALTLHADGISCAIAGGIKREKRIVRISIHQVIVVDRIGNDRVAAINQTRDWLLCNYFFLQKESLFCHNTTAHAISLPSSACPTSMDYGVDWADQCCVLFHDQFTQINQIVIRCNPKVKAYAMNPFTRLLFRHGHCGRTGFPSRMAGIHFLVSKGLHSFNGKQLK